MCKILNACQKNEQNTKKLSYYIIIISSFKVLPDQSTNFTILVDGIECSKYNKDGDTGPSYPCNTIGQNVTIKRWDTSYFSVCNIKVFHGEYSVLHIFL